MGDTKIQWTGKTWNPLRARNILTGDIGWFCEHVSPGCGDSTGGGCYADGMNQNTYFGNGLAYKASNLPKLELFLDEKMLEAPLHWRKPQMIFPCSMTDLFGRFVKDEWIDRIAHVMWKANWHTFQTLTKRADRMRDYMRNPNLPDLKPIPNWWLGVSCEDQKTADERIPLLLETHAAVRWVSAEPLLGPIDFTALPIGWTWWHAGGLDWIVIGGESGKKARPFDVAWARSIIEQCKDAKVAVFMKQIGARPFAGFCTCGKTGQVNCYACGGYYLLRHKKGGDIDEWPEDLKIREFPKAIVA